MGIIKQFIVVAQYTVESRAFWLGCLPNINTLGHILNSMRAIKEMRVSFTALFYCAFHFKCMPLSPIGMNALKHHDESFNSLKTVRAILLSLAVFISRETR